MAGEVRVPFQFHLRSVQCVSSEEAARTTQPGGVRRGANDVHLAAERFELHPDPELDRMMRDARRRYAKERKAAAERAVLRSALATSAYLPRDTSRGASGPARALYQSILPPQQASSPPDAAASNGDAAVR